MVDTAPSGQNRVFVSNGDTLYRKHVIGAGQSGATRYSFTFEAADSDGSDARDLLLSAVTGKPTGMALAGPVGKLFLDDSGTGTTPLALVDPSAVLGMAVVNLPGAVAYFGDVSNGDVLILTDAVEPYSSSDYRIFYGRSDDVVEYPITAFSQALSGYPQVSFRVGSAVFAMDISTSYGGDARPLGVPGPGTLSIDGGVALDFTLRLPPPTSLAELTFTCLAPGQASWTQPVTAGALLGVSVEPCPVGYAHPSVCCQGGMNQRAVCAETPGAPFQICDSTSLTFPDPNTCCSLDTDTSCVVPDGDASAARDGGGGAADCYYVCGPGGYPVTLLPLDAGTGWPACASLDDPMSGSQGACEWCCNDQGGCPTNMRNCPSNGCGDAGPPGFACSACPAGWQTLKGEQYDLCCQANAQGGTDCFSQATYISPN